MYTVIQHDLIKAREHCRKIKREIIRDFKLINKRKKKNYKRFYKKFIVLTCQGHFPNELRMPPTIRDSGNILLPHTARTSIVEFKPFNKFMNLNDTAMLGNESSIFVRLDEPVSSPFRVFFFSSWL